MRTWGSQSRSFPFSTEPVKPALLQLLKSDTKSPVWKISPWKKSLEIFGIWNHYELRFFRPESPRRCQGYINGVDLGEIARGIVNKEIQVYDGVTRFGAYKPDEKWQELFGGVEPLKLSTSPHLWQRGKHLDFRFL